jgi:hypothetical protein
LKRARNRSDNAIEIVPDLVIGESQGCKSLARQAGIPPFVMWSIVRIAIDLDDQPLRRTEEVADIGIDHMLATKFVAEPGIGKVALYANLQLRRIAAHFAGSFEKFLLRDHCPTPTQLQVNDAPHRLGHAGGMTDLQLLKGRGF